MSATSKIEWTDTTWNPVRGCTKVSPGCKNCYAETFAERWRGVAGHPYEQGFDLRLVPEKLGEPFTWRRRRRVFVNSMSDLFHEDVPFEYVLRVFAVMAKAHGHTYQVLTKRADRMRAFMEWAGAVVPGVGRRIWEAARAVEYPWARHWPTWALSEPGSSWPLSNVWLGVSVESQDYLERLNDLVLTPAAVRWVSLEPLLAGVDIRPWLPEPQHVERDDLAEYLAPRRAHLDWVVVGGESGQMARPFDIAWARRIVSDCRDAAVPVFVKQLGAAPRDRNDAGFEGDEPTAWPMDTEADDLDGGDYQGAPVLVRLRSRKGGEPAEWPEDLRVREWPAS